MGGDQRQRGVTTWARGAWEMSLRGILKAKSSECEDFWI